MNRLLPSLATFALIATLGSSAALADKDDHMGSSMSAHHHHAMATHPMYHRKHRFGNDKARCRDAKGRFLKHTDARCLTK